MEELLHTYTADGLLLEGVRHGPPTGNVAIVYVHGLTSSVFRRGHVLIGRALAEAGCTVIAGNNRGSALAYPLLLHSGGRVLGGTWFERLEEAARDLDAWIDLAIGTGARTVLLLGHSLGAIKAIVYAAEHADRQLAGLVLASPPLRAFATPTRPDLMAAAGRAVAADRPDELLDLGAPGVTFGRISAATLLSRAAIGDVTRRLRSTGCPILGLYGTAEPDIGGQDDLDRLAEVASERFTGALIPEADHLYTGREKEVAVVIGAWIESTVMRRVREGPES